MDRDVCVQDLFVNVRDIVPKRLGPQLVGARQIFFAVTEQHLRTERVSVLSRGRHKRRLAEAGLTGHEERLQGRILHNAGDCLRDRRQLVLASDDAGRSPYCQRGREGNLPFRGTTGKRFPQNFDGLNRFGKALQRKRPKRPARLRIPATCHEADHVRCEYLAPIALRTQPRRFDDRITEIIVVVGNNVAATQTDAQTNLVVACPVVAFSPLLHRDGTRDRCGGRRKRRHEPVAQVFDFNAAGLAQRLAQNRKVLTV
jgi:hypothetical protein